MRFPSKELEVHDSYEFRVRIVEELIVFFKQKYFLLASILIST